MSDHEAVTETSETGEASGSLADESETAAPTEVQEDDIVIDINTGSDNDVAANDRPRSGRPEDVPEKFWDAEAGGLRTETLLKSYRELEKKLGTMVPMPSDEDPGSRHRLQRLLGKPESPDEYKIRSSHELITADPAINAKLHEAGLSSDQAQLVYDLAAEHLVPMVEDMNREAQQSIERSRLAGHFGGEERWQAIAPQIRTWAEANLSDDVYESLSSSFDGVVAIHQMMQAREPNMISEAAVPSSTVDESQLSKMMRDPRYWRDRDPTFVAEVTAGYKRLYG